MAEENETVVTLMELSEDDKIRLQCEARERYDGDMFSFKKYCLREGREEGLQEGWFFTTLTQMLLDANRYDDLRKATTDMEFRLQLYQEFKIEL